ncbi:MAG: cysteine desulfurase [Bacteroidales bacterium]|nr:cysteine desulfurase [Bacteroidales bacterium]
MNIENIRKDFPILGQQVYGKPLVYLDNAATTQKPKQVIQAISDYYSLFNSNIHRGVHYLSQEATQAFEETREIIRQFINAENKKEIIFTKGATDSLNIIASSFAKSFINEGDEIIISSLEHHSNIVPWQFVCKERGAKLRIIPLNEIGEIDMAAFQKLINNRTRIVAVAHVSNALGTIVPVKDIIEIAHNHAIPVLIDGAQAVPHMKVDVRDLGCDFYCFSAHKMYGPMGIGILFGKEEFLEKIPPYQGGGEMIKTVTFENSTYGDLPFKFEAGTPNVAGVAGFKAAIDYLNNLGMERVAAYESSLYKYAVDALKNIDGLQIIGSGTNKTSVISFLMKGIHHYDTGTILDRFGIAVRTGHHCAQPVMDLFHIPGTIRASFGLYNTHQEVNKLVEALLKLKEMFGN